MIENRNIYRAHTVKRWTALWLNLALALFLAGCGGGSTGNKQEPVKYAAIVVQVHDSEGNPLSGFEVQTSPATSTVLTDSTGKVTLDNLIEGGYLITVQKAEYLSFSRVYTVAAGFPLTVAITYVPRVSISVQDDKGRPAAGATLSTDPALPVRNLDQNGETEYLNLPLDNYTFIVKRDKYPDAYLRDVTLSPEMHLVLESSPPEVTILSPPQNAKIASTRNIRLSGKGSDTEDGELPDSSLVWRSDQSGELGYGSELVVETLPEGSHTITLTGTDSDGKKSESSIEVSVHDFYLDTYFPLAQGATWNYRVLEPEFYVTTSSGSTEFWSIKQLTATLTKNLVREITMKYSVARGIDVYTCTYTLADQLLVENNNIYITSTEETYTEAPTSVASLKMNITTSYVPRYLLFKNFIDLGASSAWSTKSDVTVVWNYVYYGTASSTFTEWESISSTFALGAEQSVQTDKGVFPARELTIQGKTGVRKWMLAKGLGIIQIVDGSYNPEFTALLNESSLFSYTAKPIGSSISPFSSGSARPRYDLRIDRKNPKDVRKLCNLLSTMCVR